MASTVRIVGIFLLLAGATLFPMLSENPKQYLSFLIVLSAWHGASWFAASIIAAGAALVAVSFLLPRE